MNHNSKPARLRYLSYSFQILEHGEYVVCAETGAQVMLDDLRYWSLERQEAYVDADASTRAEIRARKAKGLHI